MHSDKGAGRTDRHWRSTGGEVHSPERRGAEHARDLHHAPCHVHVHQQLFDAAADERRKGSRRNEGRRKGS
eukprot:354701-Chlamydomonas_euryale.AAC.1